MRFRLPNKMMSAMHPAWRNGRENQETSFCLCAIIPDCDGETHLDEAEGEACANCGDYAETLHESPDELYSMTDPVTGAVTLGRICKACLEAGEG